MKKYLLAGIIALISIGFLLIWNVDYFKKSPPPGSQQIISEETGTTEKTSKAEEVPYLIEEVAANLETPWSIAFTSSNRILVTERPGRLRVIENGTLKPEPLHTFPEVAASGEAGLMSITTDPDYDKNKWIYLAITHKVKSNIVLKVSRFMDEGDRISEEFIVADNLPAAQFHAGCRLAFGSDGKLYITVGDATERPLAQDLNSLHGKLLRINKDGSIPSDNPFESSLIWSYGHRNSQGIDWHPETDNMYSSEHGPSVFDGPPGGDEINRIIKGGNYGWPLVSHEKALEDTISPLTVFTPAEAPASLLIYSGKAIPQFKNNLFFGALRGEGLVRLILDEKDPDKILRYEKLAEVKFGRIREVMEGPDGFIYFATSNRDGRGAPSASDDRIFRIRPDSI